ncbi:MAG: hypothetical protein Q4G24_07360 [Paracoccus sp. (in: a-proteobacteria)]|uniref:hypothetical protein n=1 Tax=Paracoccus sp. TaxID=267 RepID=UPI0026DEB526|nr:hypothetical protein [Paracoccus sp. (in: a-proteobacteria)]MDO5621272.1 hypothetical protein [Paracoccus sp. (in: a-proteobacteria)]
MATEADFDREISALRGGIAASGAALSWDGALRSRYTRLIDTMSREMKAQVQAGNMTWAEAAHRANEQRNIIMDLTRSQNTLVARALAQDMKASGLTLNQLLDKKAGSIFKKGFNQLGAGQQDEVYRAVIEAAGRSNPRVNVIMRHASNAGRGLIVLSLGVAVYNVATAEDKVAASAKEGAVFAGGIAGGALGGAAAGLVCGPGAPVCSTVTAFVGAVAGAFGVSLFF